MKKQTSETETVKFTSFKHIFRFIPKSEINNNRCNAYKYLVF